MCKTKLTVTSIIFLLATTQLMAEPQTAVNCCEPSPVGGLEVLGRNVVYPLFQQSVREDADVILNFYVDATGNVSNIEVAKSGGAIFDKSAIDAVMKSEWNPAMQNGYPVALTFALPFEFRSN